MGIIKRLILLFYVLTVLTALIICAGVCLRFISADVWQNELNYIVAKPETLGVVAVMILASLILLGAVFSRKSNSSLSLSGDVHLEIGKPGEVKVTIPAIVGVVERAAVTVSGVRAAEASVYRQDKAEMPIKVHLEMVLSQGYSAPRVSEATVATINDALLTALELQNVPVEVKVKEITHAIIERDKRVV